MMGGTPPAGLVWKVPSLEGLQHAFGLLQLAANPDQVNVALQSIADAQIGLDTKATALNDYETKLSAREAAAMKREQALKSRDDDHLLAATALADAKAQHEAEKAAFDVAKASELAAQEVTRANINRDAGMNKAAANKLAAQRDELASQEVAIRAMRAGLEEREKAVEASEAAFAAKQARLAAAMKGD